MNLTETIQDLRRKAEILTGIAHTLATEFNMPPSPKLGLKTASEIIEEKGTPTVFAAMPGQAAITKARHRPSLYMRHGGKIALAVRSVIWDWKAERRFTDADIREALAAIPEICPAAIRTISPMLMRMAKRGELVKSGKQYRRGPHLRTITGQEPSAQEKAYRNMSQELHQPRENDESLRLSNTKANTVERV